MENFPTETLLNIFGFITDGRTLLDGVSLVCSRWNSLAKDPRAWAGVRVELSTTKLHFYKMVPVDAARVVSLAPALKQLTVEASVDGYDRLRREGQVLASLETALKRCNATIRSVVCGDIFHLPPPVLKKLFKVLKSNKKNIRELSVKLRGHGSHHTAVLNSIAIFEDLEELKLESNKNPCYTRELKGRLPALRALVYTLAPAGQQPANHVEVLQDILEGAAGSLRRVQIDMALHPTVVEFLSKCSKISSLTVNAGALVAVRGMDSLRRLTVALRESDSVLPRHLELLDCASLPALRELKVFSNVHHAGESTDAALLAVGRAAPNLTRLHLATDLDRHGLASDQTVTELLGLLPRLTHVILPFSGPSVVPRLMALEQLESVRVSLSVRAHQMKECCDQLRELKRLRPGLVGMVKVDPIQEVAQTFSWRKPRNV